MLGLCGGGGNGIDSRILTFGYIRLELVAIVKTAVPSSLSFLATFLLGFQCIYFAGKFLGDKELGGAALGYMTINVTSFSLVIGMLTALDTLGSQAYGSKNFKKLGILLQRGWVVGACLMSMSAVILWFSSSLLHLLGQTPEVIHFAEIFTRWMMITLPLYLFFASLRRYLLAQYIVNSVLIISTCGVLVATVLKLDFLSIPLGLCCGFFTMDVGLVVYLLVSGVYKKTWGGLSTQAFKNLGEFVKLGGSGMLMLCAEWWAFEFIALFAGWLSHYSLDAQAIMGNIHTLAFMIPLGLSAATTTRVGNYLGAGQHTEAAASGMISVGAMFPLQLLLATVYVLKARWVASLLSNEPAIWDIVAHAALPQGVCIVTDAMQGICGGILRGCGKQKIGGIVNIFAYYVIGVPGAYFFGVHMNMGVRGLWVGILLGSTTQMVVYIVVLLNTNWKKESMLASSSNVSEDKNALVGLEEMIENVTVDDDGVFVSTTGSEKDLEERSYFDNRSNEFNDSSSDIDDIKVDSGLGSVDELVGLNASLSLSDTSEG